VIVAWLNLVIREREPRVYSRCSLRPEDETLLARRMASAHKLLDQACALLRGIRNLSQPTPGMLYLPGLLELDPEGILDRLHELVGRHSLNGAALEPDLASEGIIACTLEDFNNDSGTPR